MSDDNIIKLADHRPAPKPEAEPMVSAEAYHTAVPTDIWEGFSPETKADALANDLTANMLMTFERIGMEPTDAETTEVYDALAKISNRFFGVTKEDSDGE